MSFEEPPPSSKKDQLRKVQELDDLSFDELLEIDPRALLEGERFAVHEFTPQEIREFFSSPKFLEALAVAARFTQNQGYESAFKAYVGEQKDEVFIPEIFEGGTESVSIGGDAACILKALDDRRGFLERVGTDEFIGNLFDYHFHPEDGGAIIPSSVDVRNYRGQAVALAGVGQVGPDGMIEILLLKRRFDSTYEEIDTYENEASVLDSYASGSQRAVQASLESMGYLTGVIRFTNKNGQYSLSDESFLELEKLGSVKIRISSTTSPEDLFT